MTPVKKLRLYLCLIFFGLWSGQFWGLDWQISSQWPYHQTITLTGTINSWPDIRDKSQRFYLRTEKGRVLIVTKPGQELRYGDRVTVTGKVSKPVNFPGFDYKQYLQRFQVEAIIKHPTISVQQRSTNILVQTRYWFEHNLQQNLPRPNQELAAGVLIGTKTELPNPAKDAFKLSGLQHLIVVSGSNVAILIAIMSLLLRRFGPIINMVISSLVLGAFLFITGAEPPVLRASLFGLVIILAINSGRFIDTANMLLLAGVLIGIINPMIVQSDVSFWLSFSATAGILLGFPYFQKYTATWPDPAKLKSLMGVTSCAQLAVMPVLIMTFGSWPWIGLISNLLAEPVIPFTMMSAFLAGVAGDFSLLAIPALICTEYLHLVALFFGLFPSLILPTWVGKIMSIIWIGFALKVLTTDDHFPTMGEANEQF